ncbi:7170_t:CDS:2 [Funneliformis caledonium]|uniref:7170_t:CDS:1 n=1 Tax=Funneliformis caledonium TaxID=1117310 RepID=A0A9N9ECH5_9GLOM|nr:7170_t:CDS:2 [Funneliformis caledonium]
MPRRIKWTQEELDALEKGMNEHGTNWETILLFYGPPGGPLKNRNSIQLKDKARNEKRRREKEGLQLGIFEKATGPNITLLTHQNTYV